MDKQSEELARYYFEFSHYKSPTETDFVDESDFVSRVKGKIFFRGFLSEDDIDESEEKEIGRFVLNIIHHAAAVDYDACMEDLFDLSEELSYYQSLIKDGDVDDRKITSFFSGTIVVIEDVILDESFRGKGLLKKLIKEIHIFYSPSIMLACPWPEQYNGIYSRGKSQVSNQTISDVEKCRNKLAGHFKKLGFKPLYENSNALIRDCGLRKNVIDAPLED